MSIWKKLFSNSNSEEKIPTKDIADNSISSAISLRGAGTDNPFLNRVYKDRLQRINQWRNRYSKTEYPYKVALNTVYQILTLKEMWSYIQYCFTQGKVYNDFGTAEVVVQKKSGDIALEKVHPIVESKIRSGALVGPLNLKMLNELIEKAQKGNNNSVEEIELCYFWYTGAVEIAYAYAAFGLLGLNKMQAMQQVSSLIVGGDPDDFISALGMFGTNAELCYKKMPDLW